jgi:hypothetical protein
MSDLFDSIILIPNTFFLLLDAHQRRAPNIYLKNAGIDNFFHKNLPKKANAETVTQNRP